MREIDIRIEDPDTDDARRCLAAYYTELGERFSEGFSLANNPTDAADMRRPRGFFFLARDEGEAIACAALLRRDGATAELKRMWVASKARGRGVARRLLAAIEDNARQEGFSRIRLDTNRALTEARDFYLKAGYREIARFNDNPYAHHWFERQL